MSLKRAIDVISITLFHVGQYRGIYFLLRIIMMDFLVKKTFHKQLTFVKSMYAFKIINSARYEWGSQVWEEKREGNRHLGKR